MIIQNNGLAKVVNRKIEKFPKRFWDYVLYKAEIELEKKWIDLSKKNVNKLVQVLFHSVYDIQGKTTFKEEFVTAGGINTQDIDNNTMMSKKLSNLYFIGEVTNIDGITGGFNFQNTWTSATVCAMDIAEKAKQCF
jgi:predicted flavoprotein YhiN